MIEEEERKIKWMIYEGEKENEENNIIEIIKNKKGEVEGGRFLESI